MKALVIPARMSAPCRVVEWEAEDDLLHLLYREIDCHTVEAFGLPAGITVWVDEEGRVVDDPVCNFRLEAMVSGMGLVLAGPLMGTAVLTGGPDGEGNATGLSEALLDALERVLEAIPDPLDSD